MSAEIVQLPTPPERSTAIQPFQPHSIDEVKTLARMLSESSLVPGPLRNKPADVATIVLHGASLGIDAMASLRQIHIIDGKPVLAADLIVGLILRSGAAVHFTLVQSTATVATYETQRRGSPMPVRMSFTIEQARAANLTGKGNWKNYPDAMLRARAASALGRAVYPDVCGNLYDPDELEPTPIVDVTPAKPVDTPDVVGDLVNELDHAHSQADLDRLKPIIVKAKPTMTNTAWQADIVPAMARAKARVEAGTAEAVASQTPADTTSATADFPF